MKLPESNIHTESGGSLDTYQFSLEEADQGLIFEMLRKKIYTDPIGTIIREISSNARDANRENGNPNTPIKISIQASNKLLNNGEYKLAIIDNGPGISPDRMANIFVKYGKSTKREDNSFTGGFGVGGKTPFSYKDVFNIKTIYGGVEYSYIAYIDETKRGKIQLQSKKDSSDSTGTSIIIPINKEDSVIFQKKALYFTSLWETQPEYLGFNIIIKDLFETIYEDDKIKIINDPAGYNKKYNSINALIDGIPYSIEHQDKINFKYSYRNYNDLFLKFDNGEVEVSTNRETLHYNDLTINKINERFDYIKKLFLSFLEKEIIEKSNSFLEASAKFANIRNTDLNKHLTFAYDWLSSQGVLSDLKYEGKELIINYRFYTKRFIEPTYDGLKYKYESYHNSTISTGLLVNPIYKAGNKLHKSRTDYIRTSIVDNKPFLLLKEIDEITFEENNRWANEKYEDLLEKENQLIADLNLNILSYDDIVIPKVKRVVQKKDYVNIRYREVKHKRSNYSNTSSSTFKLYRKQGLTDLTKKFVYITVDTITGFTVSEKDYSVFKIFNYYNDNKYSLMVINEKMEKDLVQLLGFISLDDARLKIENKLNGLAKLSVMLDLYDHGRNNKGISLLKFGKKYINKKYIKAINKMSKLKVVKPALFNLVVDTFNIEKADLVSNGGKFKINKQLIKTREVYTNIGSQYPLLNGVGHWEYEGLIDHINLYIQSCDKAQISINQ